MPLYPEQGLFRAQVADEDYRYWIAAVCRDLAGAAGAELRSVLPAAAEAASTGSAATIPHNIHMRHAALVADAIRDVASRGKA